VSAISRNVSCSREPLGVTCEFDVLVTFYNKPTKKRWLPKASGNQTCGEHVLVEHAVVDAADRRDLVRIERREIHHSRVNYQTQFSTNTY